MNDLALLVAKEPRVAVLGSNLAPLGKLQRHEHYDPGIPLWFTSQRNSAASL